MDLTVEDLSLIKLKTRLRILELLSKRRATVTELSNALNLSKSTVHYHLNCLCERGFVKKREDGRKWVYYEITNKGRLVVEKRKIIVMLGIISATLTLIGAVRVWQVCSEKREIVDSLRVFPYSEIALVAFGICLGLAAYCLKVKYIKV